MEKQNSHVPAFFFLDDHSPEVTANPHCHREEVGSSWSGGVALGADLPSAGTAHLQGKQVSGWGDDVGDKGGLSLEGEEKTSFAVWCTKYVEENKIWVRPQLCHLLVTYHLLESSFPSMHFSIPFLK